MKKLMAIAALAATAVAVSGCFSIEVEDKGCDIVRGLDGAPLVDNEGKVQLAHRGQIWKVKKHWVETAMEQFDFTRKPGDDIALSMKNYKDVVSAELDKLVATSFKGAAELAAKVGAAIATAGGSVAGEAGYGALKDCMTRFLAKGGDANKASVTCSGGSCTISDGVVSEVCEGCCEGGACGE